MLALRNKFNKFSVAGLLALAAAFAPPAFAGGGVDVTAVTAAIAAAATPIAAIGAAVLLILVGIKVYKWVRRAM
jgi:hypothetical protein